MFVRCSKNIFLIFVLYFNSQHVIAINTNSSLILSLDHYDNINRTLNPSEEWVETIRGRFGVTENTSNLILNVNASIALLNYRNDVNADQTNKTLNATSLWIIDAKRFEWLLSDLFTQTVIDPLGNITQSNTQDVNVFTTGPNYYFRFNAANNLNVTARIIDAKYENGLGDSTAITSTQQWLYLLNPGLSISANTAQNKTDYASSAQNDFIRTNIFARVNYVQAKNTFEAEIGLTKIDFDSQADSDNSRYRIAFQNQRTSKSDVRFEYSHDLTDSNTTLTANTGNQSIATVSGTGVFINDNLIISYNRRFNIGTLLLNYNRNSRDYVDQDSLNLSSKVMSILTTYKLGNTSTLSMEGSRTDTVFDNSIPKREDRSYLYRAGLTYNSSKRTSVNLRYEEIKRESTILNNSYQDKKITVSVTFKTN